VLDSSALVAVILREREAQAVLTVLDGDAELILSVANLVETAMVLIGRGGDTFLEDLQALIGKARIVVRPVDPEIASLAIDAFRCYGKGRHPAHLNFGDCFAYATAKALDAPLLFISGDFRATDLSPAL
jgi:ribonuclease VapC